MHDPGGDDSGEDTGADDEARHETASERADRNWDELLQELRVTQTGVQILAGFLLTLAFQARFDTLDAFQRGVYVVTLLLAIAAVALFIAPVAYHRALFRRRSKRRLVDVGARFAKLGLLTVGLVVTGAVLLVVDVVTSRAGGITAGVFVAALLGTTWYLLPRRMVRQVEDDD